MNKYTVTYEFPDHTSSFIYLDKEITPAVKAIFSLGVVESLPASRASNGRTVSQVQITFGGRERITYVPVKHVHNFVSVCKECGETHE